MTKESAIYSFLKLIPGVRRSLSTQLLVLTVVVVLITEIIIMIPSVANHHRSWLNMRAQAAYLVGIALEDIQQDTIQEKMVDKIFGTADIKGIIIQTTDGAKTIQSPSINQPITDNRQVINLKEYSTSATIFDTWKTVAGGGSEYIEILGNTDAHTLGNPLSNHIILSRSDLRKNLRRYALNILGLSLVISIITACFVFWSLDNLIIRPVSIMRKNMTAFEADPENPDNILRPSDRLDEIGEAQRGLSMLEQRSQDILGERKRLAALGAGISKISHDLRNILASAQLMSDRLVASEDPRVKKLSPRLVDALDRAITLSRETLNYGRLSPEILNIETINLHELIENVFDDTASMYVTMKNEVPEGLKVKIDRTQFYRGLTNMIKNAVEALSPDDLKTKNTEDPIACTECDNVITVSARVDENRLQPLTIIEIADNGPGLPDSAKEFLLEPFKGSHKAGGSGLGIAITSEIMKAHGGDFTLEKSDDTGATFQIIIPAPIPKEKPSHKHDHIA